MGTIFNKKKIKEIFGNINKVSFSPTIIENIGEIISTGTDPDDPTYIEKYFKTNSEISKSKNILLIMAYKITGNSLSGDDTGTMQIYSGYSIPSFDFDHSEQDVGKSFTVAMVIQNNASFVVDNQKYVPLNMATGSVATIDYIKQLIENHRIQQLMRATFKNPEYIVENMNVEVDEHGDDFYLYSDYPIDFNYLIVGLN